jgi:hypothetical protein
VVGTRTTRSGRRAGPASPLARSGRTNTPVIDVKSGARLRWYVFNLDLGTLWHNFHPHAQRWTWGAEHVDTRSLGPAESFVATTVGPDVLLPPCRERSIPRASWSSSTPAPSTRCTVTSSTT